jgi:hypothetical protein
MLNIRGCDTQQKLLEWRLLILVVVVVVVVVVNKSEGFLEGPYGD